MANHCECLLWVQESTKPLRFFKSIDTGSRLGLLQVLCLCQNIYVALGLFEANAEALLNGVQGVVNMLL